MLYEIIKAAHLVTLFVWIGGMTAVALALRYPVDGFLKPMKAYDRIVTTPAMILALSFGIVLGVQGSWFGSVWLSIKILLVLVLSGLHGALVGKLRRAIWECPGGAEPSGRWFLPIGAASLALIVLLVTIKPL
ncbi:CopD family protein [uncultured Roseobacter sp.]|uniref:CopD family protein n=1 Tax=uncultured Roseobacter sp. TaxID=114847 RepID=UPI0026292594|nr:CopD family protein [uncultured Roseobacter sp.]